MSEACSMQYLSENRRLAIKWATDVSTCDCIEISLERDRTGHSWPAAGSSEHHNKYSDSLKDGNFLARLNSCQFLRIETVLFI
jgi:hypothetical protein